jgi:hypothetical protein
MTSHRSNADHRSVACCHQRHDRVQLERAPIGSMLRTFAESAHETPVTASGSRETSMRFVRPPVPDGYETNPSDLRGWPSLSCALARVRLRMAPPHALALRSADGLKPHAPSFTWNQPGTWGKGQAEFHPGGGLRCLRLPRQGWVASTGGCPGRLPGRGPGHEGLNPAPRDISVYGYLRSPCGVGSHASVDGAGFSTPHKANDQQVSRRYAWPDTRVCPHDDRSALMAPMGRRRLEQPSGVSSRPRHWLRVSNCSANRRTPSRSSTNKHSAPTG